MLLFKINLCLNKIIIDKYKNQNLVILRFDFFGGPCLGGKIPLLSQYSARIS